MRIILELLQEFLRARGVDIQRKHQLNRATLTRIVPAFEYGECVDLLRGRPSLVSAACRASCS